MQADIIISNQAKPKNATPEPGFCKPSEEQKRILDQIVRFIDDPQQDFFILSGSAGAGKTTMVKALVEFMRKEFISFKLLAPTGRATRVLSTKTQHKVSTLHSFLYNAVESMDDLSKIIRIEFIPKEKEVEETTIYIIDEASLISDGINNSDAFISKASLLYDVVQWLYKSPEGSKIIFVGDEYQLPPINEAYSPALSKEYLENKFKLKGSKAVLTEVFRQNESSYIYKNAALLKIAIDKNNIYYNRLKNKKLYNEKLAIEYYCKHFDEDIASNITFLAWKNQSGIAIKQKNTKAFIWCRAICFGFR